MNEARQTPKVRTTLVIFLGLLLLFLGINLLMIGPYLLAILMGAILATITYPLYMRLRRIHFGRRTAAALITLAVLFLGIGPLGSFTYLAAKQGMTLGQQLAQEQPVNLDSISAKIASFKPIKAMGADPVQVRNQIRASLKDAGTNSTRILVDLLSGIPGKLVQFAVALLACFFMLTDGPRLVTWISDRLPMDRDIRAHVYASFRDTAFSALLASFAAASVHSVLMLGAYLSLGVPLAFFAAGATFILTWIPIVGSTPGWVAGAIYLFLNHDPLRGVLMVIFGIFIGVSDNIVRPWILKGRSDMHPLIGIIAIIGGIELFGLFGVFFGPILMGVLLALLQSWPVVARRFELISPGTTANAPAPKGLARAEPQTEDQKATRG